MAGSQPQNDANSQLGVRKTEPGQAGAHGHDDGHLNPQIDKEGDKSAEGGQIAQDRQQTTGQKGMA